MLRLALILFVAMAIAPSAAHGYVLGVADGLNLNDDTIAAADTLSARTYRIVIDPSVPLDRYAPAVERIRAAGMRPQLAVGGIGTSRGYSLTYAADVAVLAFKRWPDSFSVSIMNEPDLYGVAVCDYRKMFRRAYARLHALGARVLLGELGPHHPAQWLRALARCGPLTADGFSWHPYDFKPWAGGIGATSHLRTLLRTLRPSVSTPRGFSLPMFATEYGTPADMPDAQRVALWSRALSIAAQQHLAQLVVYQLTPSDHPSNWDTSLSTYVIDYLAGELLDTDGARQ